MNYIKRLEQEKMDLLRRLHDAENSVSEVREYLDSEKFRGDPENQMVHKNDILLRLTPAHFATQNAGDEMENFADALRAREDNAQAERDALIEKNKIALMG